MSNGITPAVETMKKINQISNWKKWKKHPTVFWHSSSDLFILGVSYAGLICSMLAMFGFFPMINILICMVLYNSERIVGQPWLGLQMHATIVETDFLYLLCAPFRDSYPFLMVFCVRFLIWRIMLGCGACKYATGDPTWRDLTAMSYHYQTQPLPGPFSWYFHHAPQWFHKLAAFSITHIIEGPPTFLVFGGSISRCIAFIGFTGMTTMINFSGNFGFLGILTQVQTMPLLDDWFYHYLCSWCIPKPQEVETSWLTAVVAWIMVSPYLAISLVPLWITFGGQIPWVQEMFEYLESTRFQKVKQVATWTRNALYGLYYKIESTDMIQIHYMRFWMYLESWYDWLSPFSIINRYAKFGSMTTRRLELIFQGSNDLKEWKEYDFKYKPGKLDKRPPFIPGHLPGLDWRMWFLGPAIKRQGVHSLPSWYHAFVKALLEGRKEVLSLLDTNPFPYFPAKYVRTVLYEYMFSDYNVDTKKGKEEEEETVPNGWWKRKLIFVCGKPRQLSEWTKED